MAINKDADLSTGPYDQSFQDAMVKQMRENRKHPSQTDTKFYGHSTAGKKDSFYKNVMKFPK